MSVYDTIDHHIRGSGAPGQFKFGFNDTIGNTEATVWDLGDTEGLYVYPSAASTLTVSSADTADTSAGTGARTVEVQGLDGDYRTTSEIVTLAGQMAVNTANQYLRIFRMRVMTAGSGEENAGIVYAGTGTVTNGVPANKYAAITAGQNQTLMALWTVPAGATFYPTNVWISSFNNNNAACTVRFMVRRPGQVFQVKNKFVITRGFIPFDLSDYPGRTPEKSDIEIRAVRSSGSGNIDISASFSGVLRYPY